MTCWINNAARTSGSGCIRANCRHGNRMAPRAGMPEFYREYLRGRWTAGCQSGRLLTAGIQARGYVGCYAGLARLLALWREPAPIQGDTPIDHAPIASEAPIACVPVRH